MIITLDTPIAISQKNDLDREIVSCQLAIHENVVMRVLVKTLSPSNEYIDRLDEHYVMTAGDNELIKRDLATGNMVLKYIKPENSMLKYRDKQLIQPFLNNEFVDWVRDEENNYVINPDYASAVSEREFYSQYLQQSINVYDTITAAINEANLLYRFDV